MNSLSRESGEERPEQISFHQYQRRHSFFSFSNTSWWELNEHKQSSLFFFGNLLKQNRVDGNELQPTEGVNRTPCLSAFMLLSHVIPSVCQCACVFDLSSTLASHFSFVSPIFNFTNNTPHARASFDLLGKSSTSDQTSSRNPFFVEEEREEGNHGVSKVIKKHGRSVQN